MKKLIALFMLAFMSVAQASDVTGTWVTIDDETGEKKSVVEIYEFEGATFGRVIHLFKNADKTAENVKGRPKILGLDILWGLKAEDGKYKGGKILDPKKGKIYNAEIWREGDNLIVRGKIAFLGRNQTWLKDTEFKTSKNMTPVIPELED